MTRKKFWLIFLIFFEFLEINGESGLGFYPLWGLVWLVLVFFAWSWLIHRASLHALSYMIQTEKSYFCHPVTESSPRYSQLPAESRSWQNASLNKPFCQTMRYVNSKAHENVSPSQISAAVALFLFSHHKILPIMFKQKISPIRRMREEEPKGWHRRVWPALLELAFNEFKSITHLCKS